MSVLFKNDDISVYKNKDGRTRVYDKHTKKVTSYPRMVLAEKLGRPLELYEQAHHRNEMPLDNDPDNLEVRLLGEHQSFHSRKYYDTTATCAWCGKEFLWTAEKQQKHYSNHSRATRGNTTLGTPFCSKHCSGAYGAHIQNVVSETGSSRRKLTDDDIRYIRSNYIPHDRYFGSRELARRFGVSYSTIIYIIQNKTYKEIEP